MVLFLAYLLSATNSGVIVVDNVWFYGEDHKMRILSTGDVVQLLGMEGDMVRAKHGDIIAKIHEDVMIDFAEKIAEDKLFIFAKGYYDESEFKQAARLFTVFIEYFPKSQYLENALYYCGLAHEEYAKDYDNTMVTPDIVLNKRSGEWFYSGSSYETIINKFPKSTYAPKAGLRLIKILRQKNVPWEDSISLITAELKAWYDFIKKYKTPEEYATALLEIGYLNRILFQTTKDPAYNKASISVFQTIVIYYPNTVYSATANVNLYEIGKGKEAYYY